MRVPVSWLNSFLDRELTAREIDDLLGEAGVTVAGIEAIGVLSPGVVAARVETRDTRPGRAYVTLPTRELVDLPACGLQMPSPGTMVAVGLPGATLFADPARHKVLRIPASGQPGQAVGRVCTAAELGLGREARIQVLSPDVEPGTPVASLFPDARLDTGGEEVLTLRIPDALAHCRSLSGLAREINNRLGCTASLPRTPATVVPRTGRSLAVQVLVADLAACAVLGPAPVGDAEPVIDWRLPALAGLEAGTELDRALLIAAVEYGAYLSAHLVPADGSVAVRISPDPQDARHADFGLRITSCPSGCPPPSGLPQGDGQRRLLVLATAPADLAEGPARCQRAAERVFRLLFPGVHHEPAPAALAVGMASGPESARRRIALDPAELAAKVGLAIGAARCRDLLSIIGARTTMIEGDLIEVAVPPSRPDLSGEDALAAELIRLLGFAALPATVPDDAVRPEPARRYRALAAVRQVLASRNFHEAITPVVCADAITDEAPDTPWSAGAVSLAVTASTSGTGAGWLRRSLVPGLVRVSLGQDPHGAVCRLYEMGTVVVADSAGTREPWFLAIVRSARVVPPDPWPLTWEEEYWEVLDAAKTAARALDVGELSASAVDDPRFHSGTGALLSVRGRPAGHLGALCPAALGPAALGPAALAPPGTERIRLVAAELDLDALLSLPSRPRVLTPPARFPVMKRDISLVLPDGVPAQQVLDALGAAGPLLRSTEISAVYRDPRNPDAPRIMTVRLTLGSPWRTLGRQEALAAVEQATLAARSAGALPRNEAYGHRG